MNADGKDSVNGAADDGAEERFTVSIGLHEDFILARAVGELDYAYARMLHRQLKDAWEMTRSAGLMVDLSGLTFCDSMGVGILVLLLLRQSREQQSTLVLSAVPTTWSAS
ncbi:anti-sigma factor antagonist [Nonomuraea deserti]|uniref:Anti-sigma factor antagonist n=1 Tax=Nonomuraea deserti TaxID=1848322 RepID=A0A4R4V4P8_9ACTN|nr:STAS domain-containing protein [Nonomuraea deserti]TDC99600.1 anti-sigma factor antagonist [Nonomuraea deserti]